MKKILLLLAFSNFAIAFAQKKTAVAKPYFPSALQWERKSPHEAGIDSLALKNAIQYAIENETKVPKDQEMAQIVNFYKEPFSDAVGPFATRKSSSGLVIHKGYIVGSWGDVDFSEQTNSVTKSFLSLVVGLAVDKKMIRSIDDKVGDYVQLIEPYDPETYRKPEDLGKSHFLTPFATEHNKKITWNHMLRQTSDWEGTLWGKPDWADRPSDKPQEWLTRKRNEPGSVYKYNDTRVNALALATTAVWHQPLPEVLRTYIMEPIGASNSWHWTGYRNSWIVLDGKMMQSVSGGGHFGGGLFINAMDMARFGLLTLRNGNWDGKQLIDSNWIKLSRTPTSANTGYGFMNYFLNTDKKFLPSAPASAYAHIGNGTNMIYVDEVNDLVIVARWIENSKLDELVKRFLAALKQ
jgi:CubicO group peptidase (beta-lactamase class C family)